MNSMIYNPLKEFDGKFKNLHLDNTKKYLEDLVLCIYKEKLRLQESFTTIRSMSGTKTFLLGLQRK